MSSSQPKKLTPELERAVRELFPPVHPAVVSVCKLVAWGKP